MFKKNSQKRYVMGRLDNTSETSVDLVARAEIDPLFVKESAGDIYGLYLVGDDELWLDKQDVDARRLFFKNFNNGQNLGEILERELECVAFGQVITQKKDEKTGEILLGFEMPNGELEFFNANDVVRKRNEIRKKPKLREKKSAEELDLESAARMNLAIVLHGHKDCEYSMGVFLTEDGRMKRYSLGEIKAKRIQLGLEENMDVKE